MSTLVSLRCSIILHINRSKPVPGGKAGVDIEDNPAYGVNYHKTSSTEPSSNAAHEALYEHVQF